MAEAKKEHKHTLKERVVELNGKRYKQKYCTGCEQVFRSEIEVAKKEGDK